MNLCAISFDWPHAKKEIYCVVICWRLAILKRAGLCECALHNPALLNCHAESCRDCSMLLPSRCIPLFRLSCCGIMLCQRASRMHNMCFCLHAHISIISMTASMKLSFGLSTWTPACYNSTHCSNFTYPWCMLLSNFTLSAISLLWHIWWLQCFSFL